MDYFPILLIPIKYVKKISTLITIKSVRKNNTLKAIKSEARRGLTIFCDCCTTRANMCVCVCVLITLWVGMASLSSACTPAPHRGGGKNTI